MPRAYVYSCTCCVCREYDVSAYVYAWKGHAGPHNTLHICDIPTRFSSLRCDERNTFVDPVEGGNYL